jgi:hypothetical protein
MQPILPSHQFLLVRRSGNALCCHGLQRVADDARSHYCRVIREERARPDLRVGKGRAHSVLLESALGFASKSFAVTPSAGLVSEVDVPL